MLQTALGRVMGTPWYMSPEQCGSAEELDYRSDVYSIGAIAYELLAGWPPFQDPVPHVPQHRQFHDAPEPLRSLCCQRARLSAAGRAELTAAEATASVERVRG